MLSEVKKSVGQCDTMLYADRLEKKIHHKLLNLSTDEEWYEVTYIFKAYCSIIYLGCM